jgi:hypothetical protein
VGRGILDERADVSPTFLSKFVYGMIEHGMKKIIQVYLAYKIIIRYTSKESFSQDTIINQQKEIHGDRGLIDFSQAKQASSSQQGSSFAKRRF